MMNKEQFQGQWNQLKGKIKEKWGKLTDDDLTAINGKYDQFIGKLQSRYGIAKERAEKDFNDFFSSSSKHDVSKDSGKLNVSRNQDLSRDEEVSPRKPVNPSERPHKTKQ